MDPESNPAIATEHFLHILLELYFSSSISAEKFATLCWFARLAGVEGEAIEKYGKRPGARSGHYQRHLDAALGFNQTKDRLYHVPVQGLRKGDVSRTNWSLPVIPVHESIAQEIQEGPSMLSKLHEALDTGYLPQAYTSHPVVQSTPDRVVPITLYMDGVAYSQTDTVVGIWCQNALTNTRHLAALARKRLCCRCGRRGWCTFWGGLEVHPLVACMLGGRAISNIKTRW